MRIRRIGHQNTNRPGPDSNQRFLMGKNTAFHKFHEDPHLRLLRRYASRHLKSYD